MHGRLLSRAFVTSLACAIVAVMATRQVGGTDAPATRPVGKGGAVPPSRGGGDLVGTRIPPLAFDRWVRLDADGKGEAPADDARLTLYRWWTDTCPFCETSLPALDGLRQKYGTSGLRVVAVYHPKPPREVGDAQVRAAAKRLGFAGAVAVDSDWSVLKRLWLSTGDRRATSASFLVDAKGVIRWVHPGPDLFPSDDAADARQDADYNDLERAVRAVLDERGGPTTRAGG